MAILLRQLHDIHFDRNFICAHKRGNVDRTHGGPEAEVPIVKPPATRVDNQVLAEGRVAPEPQAFAGNRCVCSYAPAALAPCTRAPAVTTKRRREARVDLIRGDRACAAVGSIRCVGRYREGDLVAVGVDEVGDLMLGVQNTCNHVAAQRHRSGECHKVPEPRTVGRVRYDNDVRPVCRSKGCGARYRRQADRRDVGERAAARDVVFQVGADTKEVCACQSRPVDECAAHAEERVV